MQTFKTILFPLTLPDRKHSDLFLIVKIIILSDMINLEFNHGFYSKINQPLSFVDQHNSQYRVHID